MNVEVWFADGSHMLRIQARSVYIENDVLLVDGDKFALNRIKKVEFR